MSILDNNQSIQNNAEIAAKQIIQQTRQTYSNMVRSFNDGARFFWNNPRGVSPTDIAKELGSNAKEVFQLHYALGQLISNVKPDAIQPGLSIIGQFTMNDDGTVTIINQPSDQTNVQSDG